MSVTCLLFYELGLSVSVACLRFLKMPLSVSVPCLHILKMPLSVSVACLRFVKMPTSVSVACLRFFKMQISMSTASLRSKKSTCRCMCRWYICAYKNTFFHTRKRLFSPSETLKRSKSKEAYLLWFFYEILRWKFFLRTVSRVLNHVKKICFFGINQKYEYILDFTFLTNKY